MSVLIFQFFQLWRCLRMLDPVTFVAVYVGLFIFSTIYSFVFDMPGVIAMTRNEDGSPNGVGQVLYNMFGWAYYVPHALWKVSYWCVVIFVFICECLGIIIIMSALFAVGLLWLAATHILSQEKHSLKEPNE